MVFLNRLVRSAAQRNTVNGRVQILHSMPRSSLIIWMNGLSVAERQSLQTAGKSETSAPLRFMSDLGPAGGIVMVGELLGGRGFEVELRWPAVMLSASQGGRLCKRVAPRLLENHSSRTTDSFFFSFFFFSPFLSLTH